MLTHAVRRLKQRQPAISIELFEDTSARLLQLLAEGRIDLAICRTSVAAHPEGFELERLCNEHVGVAVGSRHPLAAADVITLAEVVAYPWVLFPGHMPLRTLLERELIEAGLPFPAHAIETSSTFASILLLADSDELVALFSAETVDFFERHQLVRRLPLTLAARVEPYGIVSRRGSTSSPAAAILVEEIRRASERYGVMQQDSLSSGAPAARILVRLGKLI